MSFQEAKESMSDIVRWVPNPKNAEDKSIYLGNVLTGYYVGKKEDVGQNNSTIYEFELSDLGPNLGRKVSIWGSALLDGRFEEIPLNCMVRVTCLGSQQPKTPKGRAYMNFKVEFDKDSRRPANFNEVAGGTAVAAPAAQLNSIDAPAPETAFQPQPVAPNGY